MTSTRRAKRPVSEQERNDILARFLEVGSVGPVARQVGRHYVVVARVVDQAGLPRRRYRQRYDAQVIREVHETDGRWMENGLSLRDYIAQLIRLRQQL